MEFNKLIPPVPKFNLAASDILEKNKCERKRANGIKITICETISKLESQLNGRCSLIEKRALDLIQPSLLTKLKRKKYHFIALAAISYVCSGEDIQLNSDEFCLSKNKIKETLQIIEDHYKLTQFKREKIINEIRSSCMKLGLNEKFQSICFLSIDFIHKYKLLSNISFGLIAGLIIKLIGDMIFQRKGGLKLDCIATSLMCDLKKLNNKIDLTEPYAIRIIQELVQSPILSDFFQ